MKLTCLFLLLTGLLHSQEVTKSVKNRSERGTMSDQRQLVRGDTGKWNDTAMLLHAEYMRNDLPRLLDHDPVAHHHPKSLKFICLLAAPEGIEALQAAHPDVPIYTAAIDSHLNEHGYIVPGLGDAGDRIYGTK